MPEKAQNQSQMAQIVSQKVYNGSIGFENPLTIGIKLCTTLLVKSFAHLNGIFALASLEEIGKLWKWWTVYSGVPQLTDFLGMIICDGF